MRRSEFLTELFTEILPVQKPILIKVFRLLFPTEDSGSPFLSTVSFHIRHRPYDFYLIVREFLQTETGVGLAGV
jgi:hypothetical protein